MNVTGEWFKAAEQVGETVGIRYGRFVAGTDEPEWMTLSHCDYDGIGGFAKLLRDSNVVIPALRELPKTNYPNRKLLSPLLNLRKKYAPAAQVALRDNWDLTEQGATNNSSTISETSMAWHVFSEKETDAIRAHCRDEKVTVNSRLLKLLDQAVRPDTKRPELAIPWLIPVNLRGDMSYRSDTENHVSCVEPSLSRDDTTHEVQQQIKHCLELGEHRRNHLTLAFTKIIPMALKRVLLQRSRNGVKGTIGVFSNLGVWDSGKNIATNESWLFCPPVCMGQMLAAGCVTFQGKLGIAIQAHPDIPNKWMLEQKWMESLCNEVIAS